MNLSRFGVIAVGIAVLITVVLVARRMLHTVIRSRMRIRVTPGVDLSFPDRVVLRYEPQRFHTWMFAWFKTRLDPMFDELPVWLKPISNPGALLDLGCGFGFTSTFLLEWFPAAEIFAVDPSGLRVSEAAAVLGPRGHVFQGAAPDFDQPEFPDQFDAAFFLDVLHFLSDAQLDLTLQRIRQRLKVGNRLIIRCPVVPRGFGSILWHGYQIHGKITGTKTFFRTIEQVQNRIQAAGFDLLVTQQAGKNPELFWFICVASE